jgi:small nuclear ribonucleoprotein
MDDRQRAFLDELVETPAPTGFEAPGHLTATVDLAGGFLGRADRYQPFRTEICGHRVPVGIGPGRPIPARRGAASGVGGVPCRSGTFMGMSPPRSPMSGRPLDILEESLGETVAVQLKGGELFEGELTGYDQHMNLVIEESEDTTIIRGDNVVSITP